MRSQKILYFDVETTGLDSHVHEIIQFAGIIEINGVQASIFSTYIQPEYPERYDEEAQKINGLSLEFLFDCGVNRQEAKKNIEDFFSVHQDPFDRRDRFIPCAYNGNFDISFLRDFYVRQNDTYLKQWLDLGKLLDPLQWVRLLNHLGKVDLESCKLSEVSDYFGIPINAHDALSDCEALRGLVRTLSRYMYDNLPPNPGQPIDNPQALDAACDDLINQFKGVDK